MPERVRQDGVPSQEPERHDELSSGTPAPAAEQTRASQERKAGGARIAKGDKIVPAMGGRALKGRSRLTHEVPSALPVSDKLKRRAKYARKAMCTELARDVGGGRCGMFASALVKLGTEDMAMREAAMADGDRAEARKLGESARMHFVYARAECAKDAHARPRLDAQGRPALPNLAWAYDDDAPEPGKEPAR